MEGEAGDYNRTPATRRCVEDASVVHQHAANASERLGPSWRGLPSKDLPAAPREDTPRALAGGARASSGWLAASGLQRASRQEWP